jgi:hypothetical protein
VRLDSDVAVALPKAPIAWNGVVNVLAGETLYVETEEADGKLAGMKVVEKVVKPERTIVLKFSQEAAKDGGGKFMLLRVSNPFRKALKYTMHIHPAGKDKFYRTSACPIPSGLSSHESWPYPIIQVLLADLRLVETSKDKPVPCD